MLLCNLQIANSLYNNEDIQFYMNRCILCCMYSIRNIKVSKVKKVSKVLVKFADESPKILHDWWNSYVLEEFWVVFLHGKQQSGQSLILGCTVHQYNNYVVLW